MKHEEELLLDEMYEALKSLTESYRMTVNFFPPGTARSCVKGFFFDAPARAQKLIDRFEVLKGRLPEKCDTAVDLNRQTFI